MIRDDKTTQTEEKKKQQKSKTRFDEIPQNDDIM